MWLGVGFESLKPEAISCLLFHLHTVIEAVNSPAASSSCFHSCCSLPCFPHDGPVYSLESEAQVNSSSIVVWIVVLSHRHRRVTNTGPVRMFFKETDGEASAVPMKRILQQMS